MFQEKIKCCECQAWERDGADGICRRKSPVPACLPNNAKGFTLVWPRTKANEGCFEGILIEVKS